ncbi:MAG: hypothetical protein LH467_16765 [Gemmatimonadaceae bacterium]|nr:hypothetical protein [Gemmatimonadaceae bacterium]
MKVFSLGMSDEGREMIVAAVADSATIARIDEYRAMTARLADPRGLAPAERARLVKEAKPIYWLTVVDAPLGRGHVVLFGTRPMWRWQSQGAFALMLNAMANWNSLDVNERGPATPPSTAAAASGR